MGDALAVPSPRVSSARTMVRFGLPEAPGGGIGGTNRTMSAGVQAAYSRRYRARTRGAAAAWGGVEGRQHLSTSLHLRSRPPSHSTIGSWTALPSSGSGMSRYW